MSRPVSKRSVKNAKQNRKKKEFLQHYEKDLLDYLHNGPQWGCLVFDDRDQKEYCDIEETINTMSNKTENNSEANNTREKHRRKQRMNASCGNEETGERKSEGGNESTKVKMKHKKKKAIHGEHKDDAQANTHGEGNKPPVKVKWENKLQTSREDGGKEPSSNSVSSASKVDDAERSNNNQERSNNNQPNKKPDARKNVSYPPSTTPRLLMNQVPDKNGCHLFKSCLPCRPQTFTGCPAKYLSCPPTSSDKSQNNDMASVVSLRLAIQSAQTELEKLEKKVGCPDQACATTCDITEMLNRRYDCINPTWRKCGAKNGIGPCGTFRRIRISYLQGTKTDFKATDCGWLVINKDEPPSAKPRPSKAPESNTKIRLSSAGQNYKSDVVFDNHGLNVTTTVNSPEPAMPQHYPIGGSNMAVDAYPVIYDPDGWGSPLMPSDRNSQNPHTLRKTQSAAVFQHRDGRFSKMPIDSWLEKTSGGMMDDSDKGIDSGDKALKKATASKHNLPLRDTSDVPLKTTASRRFTTKEPPPTSHARPTDDSRRDTTKTVSPNDKEAGDNRRSTVKTTTNYDNDGRRDTAKTTIYYDKEPADTRRDTAKTVNYDKEAGQLRRGTARPTILYQAEDIRRDTAVTTVQDKEAGDGRRDTVRTTIYYDKEPGDSRRDTGMTTSPVDFGDGRRDTTRTTVHYQKPGDNRRDTGMTTIYNDREVGDDRRDTSRPVSPLPDQDNRAGDSRRGTTKTPGADSRRDTGRPSDSQTSCCVRPCPLCNPQAPFVPCDPSCTLPANGLYAPYSVPPVCTYFPSPYSAMPFASPFPCTPTPCPMWNHQMTFPSQNPIFVPPFIPQNNNVPSQNMAFRSSNAVPGQPYMKHTFYGAQRGAGQQRPQSGPPTCPDVNTGAPRCGWEISCSPVRMC